MDAVPSTSSILDVKKASIQSVTVALVKHVFDSTTSQVGGGRKIGRPKRVSGIDPKPRRRRTVIKKTYRRTARRVYRRPAKRYARAAPRRRTAYRVRRRTTYRSRY